MASYQHLKQDPTCQALFKNRITTLNDLQSALQDHAAFLALDTEHVSVESEKDRMLQQVGLAYLPTTTRFNPDKPRLDDFYDQHQFHSLTISINMSDQERENLIHYRGSIPNRRSSRFGHERQLNLLNLEAVIDEFIKSYHTGTKLVLVGFEMAAEWTYLSRNFPNIIPYFSYWVDLRDIAKDIAKVGVIPGLVSLLQIFGYHWKDIKGDNRLGNADNAGNDAILTLALATALLQPENKEKLRFRQQCFQIASRGQRKNSSSVLQENQEPLGARIRSQKGLLPNKINSGMKLAYFFFDFEPISTRLESSEIAQIEFRSQSHLNRFIQVNNQRLLPTGETLIVTLIEQKAQSQDKTEAAAQDRRRQRQIKKTRSSESDWTSWGDIFSEENSEF